MISYYGTSERPMTFSCDRKTYDEDPTKINNEYKKKYYDILINMFKEP